MLVKQIPPMTALTFSTRTTLRDLAKFGEMSTRRLYHEAARLGLSVMGPVFWTYHGATGNPVQVFQLDIALPVSEASGSPDGFEFRRIEPLRGIHQTHEGPWENLPGLYNRLIPQILQQGHSLNGVCRETYVHIDLAEPVNNITDVLIGIN